LERLRFWLNGAIGLGWSGYKEIMGEPDTAFLIGAPDIVIGGPVVALAVGTLSQIFVTVC
jgi:hypothetical protein